jgi:hypothetical protein
MSDRAMRRPIVCRSRSSSMARRLVTIVNKTFRQAWLFAVRRDVAARAGHPSCIAGACVVLHMPRHLAACRYRL